jgi:hypothetical protein
VDGRIDEPSGSRSSVALVDGSECRELASNKMFITHLHMYNWETGKCLRPMAAAESLNSIESPTLGDWSQELS